MVAQFFQIFAYKRQVLGFFRIFDNGKRRKCRIGAEDSNETLVRPVSARIYIRKKKSFLSIPVKIGSYSRYTSEASDCLCRKTLEDDNQNIRPPGIEYLYRIIISFCK